MQVSHFPDGATDSDNGSVDQYHAATEKDASALRYQRYKAVVERLQERTDFELSHLHDACHGERRAFVTRMVNELVETGWLLREDNQKYRWNKGRGEFSARRWLDEKLFGTQIKESPQNDRPRERLAAVGAANLRLDELLAILIRSGRPGESAVMAGEKLAREYQHRLPELATAARGELKLRDVEGLVKLVDKTVIEANDWSLTPGRYVGVAPEEVDEDFDFEESLREIHVELEDLNAEAVELAATIKKNFEELGYEGNAFVGQAFQPDVPLPDSMTSGKTGQPGKADLRMRCKAGWRFDVSVCHIQRYNNPQEAARFIQKGETIEVPVIVEQIRGNGFRARVSTPEPLSIEGPSRDAVVTGMQSLLQERLSKVEVVHLHISTAEDNPWLAVAGMWNNNPEALEAEEFSRQYRRQVDADPERP